MLSKSTEYSIRALVFIQLVNWDNRRPGVKEIAEEIDAPVAFTAKMLHVMTTHQLLFSLKGRGGGFFFQENQSDHTLLDVIRITEGNRLFTKCGLGLKECNDENPCPLHEDYERIRDDLLRLVKSETIASLAKKINEGKAVLNRILS
jgi:Rrf2 family protein